MYTVTVDHVPGHNQESFLNVSFHSQQWMDSRHIWKDSGQTWMDGGQTQNIQTLTNQVNTCKCTQLLWIMCQVIIKNLF